MTDIIAWIAASAGLIVFAFASRNALVSIHPAEAGLSALSSR